MRLRPRSNVKTEDRERILSRPESFDREPAGRDEAFRTSEASAADLAAISAPIQKETTPAADNSVSPAAVPLPPTPSRAASAGTPRSETKLEPGKAVASVSADEEPAAHAEHEQPGRTARKGGRRGIRLKNKLPGKTDLGLG